MKTLIVGAGALGGIIGARLLAVGASVSLATRNATSAEEIKASGLRVTGIGGDSSIEGGEVAPLAEYSVPGTFDLNCFGHERPSRLRACAQALYQRGKEQGTRPRGF
jgi:hypothetical protein